MIRYALNCSDCGLEFEAWFASSAAFDEQAGQGLLSCAECGGAQITKQIMAPSVKASRGPKATTDEVAMAREFARNARDHVARNFDYVGDRFADEARSMYYGEADSRPIWGEATPEESKALTDEGVPAAPLPKAFAPQPPRQKRHLN